MKIGKVPESVLKRSILRQLKTRRVKSYLAQVWGRTAPFWRLETGKWCCFLPIL